jgi:hypothetical protein
VSSGQLVKIVVAKFLIAAVPGRGKMAMNRRVFDVRLIWPVRRL